MKKIIYLILFLVITAIVILFLLRYLSVRNNGRDLVTPSDSDSLKETLLVPENIPQNNNIDNHNIDNDIENDNCIDNKNLQNKNLQNKNLHNNSFKVDPYINNNLSSEDYYNVTEKNSELINGIYFETPYN